MQANANALSASVKMKPPWQVAWPLSMSRAHAHRHLGVAGADAARCVMPIACDARSRAYIARRHALGERLRRPLASPRTASSRTSSSPAEPRRALGHESGDAFAIVVASPELALHVALEIELRLRGRCRLDV